MRFTDGCTDCILSRVEYECRLAHADEETIARARDACAALLASIRHDDVPSPVIASRVHRRAYRIARSRDPYAELKCENNRTALEVCALVENRLVSFRDRCLAAVIANTLDYGSLAHQVTDNFVTFFAREFASGFTIDHTAAIEDLSERVVYLSDNCGEIVFDRLLVRALKERGSHVTLAVRGAPILNDATVADARELGLDSIVDTLTVNREGVAELGLNPAEMPDRLCEAIERATLVIAKGMANYESLSDFVDMPPVAYLMSVKCEPIGRHVGAPVGSKIAMLSEHR
ncbi:MAG: ARMT1-like domain-containing protein [Methanomicrobiaceae archaeon]|nr:ARMT1-like domain-containing protein [Methanomicrobiaceae archaeon]